MRALLIASVTAATLIGLAGCGQSDDGGQATDQPTDQTSAESAPATTEPSLTPTPPSTKLDEPPPSTNPAAPAPPVSIENQEPIVPPGVTQVPAAQVDASAVPEYYDHRGLVWSFDDGRALQTFAMATSGCGGAEASLTGETETEVRIELRPLDQPQGGPADGRMCTTVMTPRPVTVALDAPLGDRTVVLDGGR